MTEKDLAGYEQTGDQRLTTPFYIGIEIYQITLVTLEFPGPTHQAILVYP